MGLVRGFGIVSSGGVSRLTLFVLLIVFCCVGC